MVKNAKTSSEFEKVLDSLENITVVVFEELKETPTKINTFIELLNTVIHDRIRNDQEQNEILKKQNSPTKSTPIAATPFSTLGGYLNPFRLFAKNAPLDLGGDIMSGVIQNLIHENQDKLNQLHLLGSQALEILFCISSDDKYARALTKVRYMRYFIAHALAARLPDPANFNELEVKFKQPVLDALKQSRELYLKFENDELYTINNFQANIATHQTTIENSLKLFEDHLREYETHPEKINEAHALLKTFLLPQKQRALAHTSLLEGIGNATLSTLTGIADLFKEIPGIPDAISKLPVAKLTLLPFKQISSLTIDSVTFLANTPLSYLVTIPIDGLQLLFKGIILIGNIPYAIAQIPSAISGGSAENLAPTDEITPTQSPDAISNQDSELSIPSV